MALRTTRQMVEVLGTGDSGEMRVTRQSVAVLGAPAGTVRVYRQMIEVLAAEAGGDVYDLSADSALSLSGSSSCGFVLSRSAENTVEFGQEGYLNLEGCGELYVSDALDLSIVRGRSVQSVNTLDQDLEVSVSYLRHAVSTLTLAQEPEYVGPKPGPAVNSIALTGTAYLCQEYPVSAQSILSLAGTAETSGTIRASASNSLSLLSLADNKIFIRSAASELVLLQAADIVYCYTAVSTLSLDGTAVQGQIFVEAVSSLSMVQSARTNPLTAGPGPEYDFYLPATVIDLQQSVAVSIHMLTAQSALTLADGLGVQRPWYGSAESKLQTVTQVFDPETMTLVDTISGLQDSAAAVRSIAAPFAICHYLQLVQNAGVVRVKADGIAASAESVLELDCELFKNVTGIAVNHLLLTVQAAADRCAPLTSALDLDQAAEAAINRLRESVSALSLAQGLTYSLANNPALYNYSPFIGEGAPGAPEPPSATLAGPLPSVTVPLQLFYPASEPTDSVTLRCPNLGNKDRLSFNRVLRETRGGTLICYADPIWPKIQTLVLSFSGLEAAEKDALLAFLEDHLGLEIGMLDWEHRYWKGVVVTPNDPAVQDDRDSFSVSFEFEGELV